MGDDGISVPAPDTDTDSALQCCCGRLDCAYRTHTCSVLEAVQRDARTAGELGQVSLLLLSRVDRVHTCTARAGYGNE